MGKGDGCCGTNAPRESYAMDWRENSHDMDELVVKIMEQGIGMPTAHFPPPPPHEHPHGRQQVQRRDL